jgi:outer membrane protein assembly factor BamB
VLNPVDGSPNNTFLWQDCLPGTILGAVTQVPGVIAVVDKSSLTLFNSATGAQLFNATNKYYGSPSISNGVLYVGSKTGQLTAFGT